MRLPEIVFGSSLHASVAPAQERLGQAMQGFGEVMSQGLAFIGQERLKTETARAGLDFQARAQRVKDLIEKSRVIDPAVVKKELGEDEYNRLPRPIREQAEQLLDIVDPTTGKPVVDHAGQTPKRAKGFASYDVAEPLFKTMAKRELEAASRLVSIKGWQEEFRRNAEGDVLKLWNDVHEGQMKVWLADQVAQRETTVAGLVNQRLFDQARAVVQASEGLVGREGVEKWMFSVLRAEQRSPSESAIEYSRLHGEQDPDGATEKLLAASESLGDDERTGALTEIEQRELAEHISVELRKLYGSRTDRLAAQIVLGLPPGITADKAYPLVEAMFRPGGQYERDPAMFNDVMTAVGGQLTRNAAVKKAENDGKNDALLMASLGPRGANGEFRPSKSNIPKELLDAVGADQIATLNWIEEQDRQAGNQDWADTVRDRERSHWRTDSQVERFAAISRFKAKNPQGWYALGLTQQKRIIRGEIDPATGRVAVVPGEPDAPPVGVNEMDEIHLLTEGLAQGSKERAVHVENLRQIARETAEEVWKDLRKKKPSMEAELGYRELSDRLDEYVNTFVNNGQPVPPQTQLRQWLRQQAKSGHFKARFMGVPYEAEKKIVELEQEGTPFRFEDGRTVYPPTPEERLDMPADRVVVYGLAEDGNYHYAFVKRENLPLLGPGFWRPGGVPMPPPTAPPPMRQAAPSPVPAAPGEAPVPSQTQTGFKAPPSLAPYVDLLQGASAKWGVRAPLLAAVIQYESGGRRLAVSKKGAKGLGQFMPGTAQDYGVRDPFDPVQAIDGAAHYLSDLLKAFDGNEQLAVAAYQAGEAGVRRANGGVPNTTDGLTATPKYVADILAMAGRYEPDPAPPAPAVAEKAPLPPPKPLPTRQGAEEPAPPPGATAQALQAEQARPPPRHTWGPPPEQRAAPGDERLVAAGRGERVSRLAAEALAEINRGLYDRIYGANPRGAKERYEAALEGQRASIEGEVRAALDAWDDYRRRNPRAEFVEWFVKHREAVAAGAGNAGKGT